MYHKTKYPNIQINAEALLVIILTHLFICVLKSLRAQNNAYPGFVSHDTKFAKMEKMVNFFFCVFHFFLCKKFIVANNIGYNFYILIFLQCKGDRIKSKNRSSQKFWNIHYLKKSSNAEFTVLSSRIPFYFSFFLYLRFQV